MNNADIKIVSDLAAIYTIYSLIEILKDTAPTKTETARAIMKKILTTERLVLEVRP